MKSSRVNQVKVKISDETTQCSLLFTVQRPTGCLHADTGRFFWFVSLEQI